MSLGRYSFVPWIRHGLSNSLSTPIAGQLRATTNVQLVLTGSGGDSPVSAPVEKDVELYGPGDIIGIDPRQIVSTEPCHWITDFEPNYLPYIEFYEEDFPWRYSPAASAGDRLFPWLALVVLKADEHELRNLADRSLPFIHVEDPDASLPDLSESWAWAHVHVNESITGEDVQSASEAETTDGLENVLQRNPDLAYSRIICGRKLEPKMRYNAYLVPAFETGRLAGLGLDITGAPDGLHGAWRHPYPGGGQPEPQSIPVYHQWQFETSERGDFEYLVSLLKPRVADSRIGRRNIDVTEPGSNIEGINIPDLEGVLRLGGALQVPFDALDDAEKTIVTKYDEWDNVYPTTFQSEMASFLNLNDAYTVDTAAVANNDAALNIPVAEIDDPLVTPPIYGQWHARSNRVLVDATGSSLPNDRNWLHEANLDPRHRSTAGFGTKVIQRNQEKFMAGAWAQVGKVLEANRRMRFVIMALKTNLIWHGVHMTSIATKAPGHVLQMLFPMARRAQTSNVTAMATLKRSVLPTALLSSSFRRINRPRGPIAKRFSLGRPTPTDDIVTRVANGEVEPAPPKQTPEAIPTPADLPPEATNGNTPAARKSWLMILIGVVAIILALIFGLWPLALLFGLGVIYAIWSLMRTASKPVGIGGEPPPPDAVDRMPVSPDFKIIDPYAGTPLVEPTIRPNGFGSDSPELARYKLALGDLFAEERTTQKLAPVAPAEPLNVAQFSGELMVAVDPSIVLPTKFGTLVQVPQRIFDVQVETFAPVMAYPEFDTPMYKHLLDLSDEHFVPNLQFVKQNSISILETNQPFIEAYMLGLNHEFCRELLWRSYPTDQRATSFRQFWDVSNHLDRDDKDAETLREELRDIPPIHLWPRASKLGDHDHRDRGEPAENELVLVIRGDLLKRYPTAVIYAHRAEWQRNSDGSINNKVERRPVQLTAVQEDNPPENLLKTPLYEAKAAPDIYFFGFDLTAPEAQGDNGDSAGDDPGWFFIIKERPGEPRFGLDVGDQPNTDIAVWSDMAWSDVALDTNTQFLHASQSHILDAPAETDERHEQWLDDQHVDWTPSIHSADLAYILYQLPVMVAVHAADMLPRNNS